MSRFSKVPDDQVVNVKPLPDGFTDDDLMQLFKEHCKGRGVKFANIDSYKVMTAYGTTMGFINCTTKEAADCVVECLDGVHLAPHILKAGLKSDYMKQKQRIQNAQKAFNTTKYREEPAAPPAAAPAPAPAVSTPPAAPYPSSASSKPKPEPPLPRSAPPSAPAPPPAAAAASSVPSKPVYRSSSSKISALLIVDGTEYLTQLKKLDMGSIHWPAFLKYVETQFKVVFGANRKFWFDAVKGDDEFRYKIYGEISHPSVGIVPESGLKKRAKQNEAIEWTLSKYNAFSLAEGHPDAIEAVVIFGGHNDFTKLLLENAPTKLVYLVGFMETMDDTLRSLAQDVIYVDDPLFHSKFAIRPISSSSSSSSSSSTPSLHNSNNNNNGPPSPVVESVMDLFTVMAVKPSAASTKPILEEEVISPATPPFLQLQSTYHHEDNVNPQPTPGLAPSAAPYSYPSRQAAAFPPQQQQQQQQAPPLPSANGIASASSPSAAYPPPPPYTYPHAHAPSPSSASVVYPQQPPSTYPQPPSMYQHHSQYQVPPAAPGGGYPQQMPPSGPSYHHQSPATVVPSPAYGYPIHTYPPQPHASAPSYHYPAAPVQQQPQPQPQQQPWSPFQQPPLPPSGPLRFDTIAHEVCVSVDGAPLFSLAPLMQIAPTAEKNIGYCDVPLGSAMKPYNVSLILRYAHELKGHVMEVQMHVPPTAGSAGSGNNKPQQQQQAAEIIPFGTGYFSESTGTSKLSHIVNPLLGRSQQSATLVFTLKQQSMMM